MDPIHILGESQLTPEEKERLKKKYAKIRKMLSFPTPAPPPSPTALDVEERCEKLREKIFPKTIVTQQSSPPPLSEENRSRLLNDRRAGNDQW